MQNTHDWLVEWFEGNGAVPGLDRHKLLAGNYFELGLIDSFGVIALIEDIEVAHAIKFDESAFQDRRFATVSGLAEMIDEAKSGG